MIPNAIITEIEKIIPLNLSFFVQLLPLSFNFGAKNPISPPSHATG
jgi:hypothetical protein